MKVHKSCSEPTSEISQNSTPQETATPAETRVETPAPAQVTTLPAFFSTKFELKVNQPKVKAAKAAKAPKPPKQPKAPKQPRRVTQKERLSSVLEPLEGLMRTWKADFAWQKLHRNEPGPDQDPHFRAKQKQWRGMLARCLKEGRHPEGIDAAITHAIVNLGYPADWPWPWRKKLDLIMVRRAAAWGMKDLLQSQFLRDHTQAMKQERETYDQNTDLIVAAIREQYPPLTFLTDWGPSPTASPPQP